MLDTQRSDSGYYRCVIDNYISHINQTAHVRVEGIFFLSFFIIYYYTLIIGAPLAYSIAPLVLRAGDITRLICNVFYNYPSPKFEWFASGNQPLDQNRFTIDANGDLIISPVMGDDQMEFVCRVSNSYGSSTISQFITVHVPPVVTLSKNNEVIAILDSNLTFSCSAIGRPTPQLTLYFPNGEIADDNFVSCF